MTSNIRWSKGTGRVVFAKLVAGDCGWLLRCSKTAALLRWDTAAKTHLFRFIPHVDVDVLCKKKEHQNSTGDVFFQCWWSPISMKPTYRWWKQLPYPAQNFSPDATAHFSVQGGAKRLWSLQEVAILDRDRKSRKPISSILNKSEKVGEVLIHIGSSLDEWRPYNRIYEWYITILQY